MAHFHAVVWIDHREARIIGFDREGADEIQVKSHGPHRIHHKAGTMGSGHEHDRPQFFHDVAAALADAGEILIAGPAQTKRELKAFLDSRAPDIAAKVLGVEPLDHLSDGEILAFARRFFRRIDHMTPQR